MSHPHNENSAGFTNPSLQSSGVPYQGAFYSTQGTYTPQGHYPPPAFPGNFYPYPQNRSHLATNFPAFSLTTVSLAIVAFTGITNLLTILFIGSFAALLGIISLSGAAGILAFSILVLKKKIDETIIFALATSAGLTSVFVFIKISNLFWNNTYGLALILATLQGFASIFLLLDTEKKTNDPKPKPPPFQNNISAGMPIPNPLLPNQPFATQSNPQQAYVPQAQYGAPTPQTNPLLGQNSSSISQNFTNPTPSFHQSGISQTGPTMNITTHGTQDTHSHSTDNEKTIEQP